MLAIRAFIIINRLILHGFLQNQFLVCVDSEKIAASPDLMLRILDFLQGVSLDPNHELTVVNPMH